LKPFDKGPLYVKKSIAPIVELLMSNVMVSPPITNNVSGVETVAGPTFGDDLTTKPIANDIGSSFGSLRVIRSASCADYLATAKTSLNASRITGSIERHLNCLCHRVAVTCYSMALTSTNKDVSWS